VSGKNFKCMSVFLDSCIVMSCSCVTYIFVYRFML